MLLKNIWKTPKKYPWKSFFAFENLRKFTPAETKIVRVKKSKILPVENQKVHVKFVDRFFFFDDASSAPNTPS